MKNKLPFIIIIIVFILGISISFLFKRKDSKGDYENDYISKILVDNVDIGVTYKAGNLFNTDITYGNVYEKYIDIKNETDKDVTLSININDLNVSNELVKYSIYYKISEDNYQLLKDESILTDKLIYNLIAYKKTNMSIKIVIKSYLEDKINLAGEFKVQDNLSSKDIFISGLNDVQSKLIEKIKSINGINTSGIYYYEVNQDEFSGYIIVDAQDISEIKYVYTVYNDMYMYVNYKYVDEFKKSKIMKKDEKISTKNVADICRSYSKKGCSNLNDLSYDKDGGKENFHSKVNDVINSLNNITLQENVYILDVVNDLKKSDIRGYVLINNVKQKHEIFLYLTNNIFMISGYNLTKLGEIKLTSSTIRAYNESAFNLASKDMSTVCSFSGFSNCVTLQNTPV